MRKYPDGFLEYIKSKIGSKEYRNFVISGVDYLKDGKLSCAVFVSSVLKHFDLIDDPHARVKVTVHNMRLFGWQKISLKEIEPGDVIVWEKNKSGHYHIGFYVGDEMAVSNNWIKRTPVEHDFQFRNKKLKKQRRKIVKILAFL